MEKENWTWYPTGEMALEVHHDPDSEWVLVWVRGKPDVALRLSVQAWNEFIAGIRDGDFNPS